MRLWQVYQRKYYLKVKQMKKLWVVAGLIFASYMLVGTKLHAQMYAGGSFDMSIDNGKDISLSLYPEVGYYLTEKWDVGVDLGIGHSSTTSSLSWLFSPFTRYAYLQAGKFEIIGKTSLILAGSKNYFMLGAEVTPVLAYNLNERFTLQTHLNFISCGYTYSKPKNSDATTNFNLGFNSNNLFSLGGLTVGFIYKF